MQAYTYQRAVSVNATSIASRFESLYGLKIVLRSELAAVERARSEALSELDRLEAACADPSPSLVEQGGLCGR